MARWTLIAAAATAAAAALGAAGTRPKTAWYRALDKPDWQPPGRAFPLVWTPLYASIAWSAARSLKAESREGRVGGYAALLGVDLALNAGWCWMFFTARSPSTALATIAALNAANAALVRRTLRHDRTAGILLLPYAAWTGFATALNLAICRRN
ncbi:TspO/MBR family protein [Gryllotalpicola reticulitermitis]|uniref:TspO/MBR family protein n=1 Tax=Gryllotalpicola reticulitermitis TaxID=1184153 RepID=A0ABV8Q079_9MICO